MRDRDPDAYRPVPISGPAFDASVRALLALSHDLGLHVIVEGIETPDAQRHLLRFGYQTGQGYLFGRRPMAAADLGMLLSPPATAVTPFGAANRLQYAPSELIHSLTM